jgi:hypothetical protein
MATLVIQPITRGPTVTNTMNAIDHTEARQEQARRRLLELEIAVGIAGESALAWHVAQAARSGASCAEILEAVKSGIKTGHAPVAALTRTVLNLMRKASGAQDGSSPGSPAAAVLCTDPFAPPARPCFDSCAAISIALFRINC